MSSTEFAEWQAYCGIEPFGGDVAELRFGVAAAMFGNFARDPKRGGSYSPSDFFISQPMTALFNRPQTGEEQIAIVRELQEQFRDKK